MTYCQQELTQRINNGVPEYLVVEESGSGHQRVFSIEVIIDKQSMGHGIGNGKIDPERAAAKQAISKMND